MTMRIPKPSYLLPIIFLTLWANINSSFAGHPGEGEAEEMMHASVALPEDAALPYIRAKLSPDLMDGFNVEFNLTNFNVVVPLMDTPDSKMVNGTRIMQGHIHLYVNGKKKMRVYGDAVHIPSNWLKPGINSLIASINNHMHGTFTSQQREIQTTLIFEYKDNVSSLLKSEYSWPLNPEKER